MKRLLCKKSNIIMVVMIGLLLLVGCNSEEASKKDTKQVVTLNVERTGGFLSGIGKVKVYVDGKQVMKVKETESIELQLKPGTHTIQTKGQGDKSKKVEFIVTEGQDNILYYQTEISNIYGLSLERVQ